MTNMANRGQIARLQAGITALLANGQCETGPGGSSEECVTRALSHPSTGVYFCAGTQRLRMEKL